MTNKIKRLVLLVSPPTSTNRTPEECLGLEYLVSESRLAGHEVDYMDAWMEKMTVDDTVNQAIQKDYEVIGIGPSMDSVENSKLICTKLRERGFKGKIVLGGIYASFAAQELVEELEEIDGVITGEADVTFQDYLSTLDMKNIPGAVYSNNGKVVHNPRSEETIDLDSLPFPARDSLPLVKRWTTPSHVMGSRGCYGYCSFCSVACFQKFSSEKRWRGRTSENIVSELKHLKSQGETMFKFIDDNFFGAPDKTRETEIATKIIESNLDIRFRMSLRVNDVEDKLVGLLKKAGLFAVSLGVESFVPRKLSFFAKGTTVEQNFEAVRILENHGVYVQMGFIMFDPFITFGEIEEELKGLEKTSWAITKGIGTKLFAADGTIITDIIRDKVGFVGKEGANNLYEIVDPNVRLFARGISAWAKKINLLYDKAIDPISAPKNVPATVHAELHKICVRLKELDIDIAWKLIKICKETTDLEKITNFVDSYFLEHKQNLNELEKVVDNLYEENNLSFYSSGNKRL